MSIAHLYSILYSFWEIKNEYNIQLILGDKNILPPTTGESNHRTFVKFQEDKYCNMHYFTTHIPWDIK